MLFLDTGFISGADFFEEISENVKDSVAIGGDAGVDLNHELFFSVNAANAKLHAQALATSIIKGEPINFTPLPAQEPASILDRLFSGLAVDTPSA